MSRSPYKPFGGDGMLDYRLNLGFEIDPAYGVALDPTNNKCSLIVDRSGYGRHATQAVGTNQPTWVPNVIAGRPVLRWLPAATSYMTTPNLIPNNTKAALTTIFVVTQRNADVSGRIVDQAGSAGSPGQYASAVGTNDGGTSLTFGSGSSEVGVTLNAAKDSATVNNGVPVIIAGRWDGTNVEFWRNGVLKATTAITVATATANNSGATLGANITGGLPGIYYHGDTGIIRVYNECLSAGAMDIVFRKLHALYANSLY